MIRTEKIRWKKRALCAVLASCYLAAAQPPVVVSAETTKEKLDKAKEEKEQTEQQKDALEGQIDSMEGAKDSLQGELDNLTSELTKISSHLEEVEANITAKNEEIEQTQQALAEAKETEEWQYECMKKRIRFMYEKRDSSYLEILLASGSFGEFLNESEYIEKLAEYDRKMLNEYIASRQEIEAKEAELQKQKEELDALHAEAEEDKAQISSQVSSTQSNIAGYASQISAAEAEVEAKEAQLREQEKNIAALQKQYEEELAKSRQAANSVWRDISEVTFSEGDRYLLANLIYCEAGGEPYEGQVAVGAVVINRVLSSVFPNTVSGVIYQSRQFEPVSTGRLALALAENRATESCYRAADEAMSGYTNVGRCVFFRTPIPGLTGQRIGGHIFY